MVRPAWLVVVFALAAGCSSAPDASPVATETPTPSSTQVTSTSLVTPVVETVDAGHSLFEEGKQDAWEAAWDSLSILDPEVWSQFFADGATFDGLVVGSDVFISDHQYWGAIGWTEWGEDCAYSSPDYAECYASFTSALHGPAGLEFRLRRQVWFDNSGLITAISQDFALSGIDAFDEAFDDWLIEHHPDIADSDYFWGGSHMDADAGRRAVAVVDDFIASTDAYPIEETVVAEPLLTATVGSVDVYNATPEQVRLVEWALNAFEEAGLPAPPVESVGFPPTEACAAGFSGMAAHNGETGSIDVCATPDAFMGEELPLTGRRSILHELGHLWTVGHTEDAIRSAFMQARGIETWSAPVWEGSGSEHAAEIIMWALIDADIKPRLPNRTTAELNNAYTTLTGHPAP